MYYDDCGDNDEINVVMVIVTLTMKLVVAEMVLLGTQ